MNRKVSEYENRIALLSQEMERLNINIKNKVEENDLLRRKISEYENSIGRYTQ